LLSRLKKKKDESVIRQYETADASDELDNALSASEILICQGN